jgi:serine/threonine protein kinase/tetratricopeptide (TPR) repeat protein
MTAPENNAVAAPPSGAADPRIAQVMEEYLTALEAGEEPRLEAFLARYPDLGPVLARSLEGLDFIHQAAGQMHYSVAEAEPARKDADEPGVEAGHALGDYRILREVGRGGMGVVYEAEQVSLGRRVALKVLPFASTLDARQLQRFKNEAQAAAQLHHTHIVPVYATGCERGVHYYAMQFIEGQTLAALIAELRQLVGRDPPPNTAAPAPHSAPPSRTDPQATGPYLPEPAQTRAGDTTLGQAKPGLSERSIQSAGFSRAVAQLGIQAAEALEHAHQLGIVHRDIKPGNLLVEGEFGVSTPGACLWVTDFGLAHAQSQAGLTLTGDLVGTLRYMSPEQALAKRVVVDHRTDIYSLGVTLYELLTLEPAFSGQDRQELLRQIACDDPRQPRRINSAVPVELETIVGKALEKNPADRYATAQELADDLERFLKDEPIRARRPTLVQRARKWVRRHKAAVWATAVCLAVTLLVLAVNMSWTTWERAAWREKRASDVRAALREVDTFRTHALTLTDNPTQWDATRAAARSAFKRAEALASPAEALHPDLLGEIQERKAQLKADKRDRRFVARFEAIRMMATEVDLGRNRNKAPEAYATLKDAFELYAIQLGVTPPAETVALIRQRPESIRPRLMLALLYWCSDAPHPSPQDREWYLAVRDAGLDPLGKRARSALNARDWPKLKELILAELADRRPPALLLWLADQFPSPWEGARLELLERIQSTYPGDFWSNVKYASALEEACPARWEEAVRYYSAALALRPDHPAIFLNLGHALARKGDLDRAIRAFRSSIHLNATNPGAHCNLGLALLIQGKRDEAIAEFRKAIVIDPKYAVAHNNLGGALKDKGELDAAIREWQIVL